MAAANEINIAGSKLFSDVYLLNKNGKFTSEKSVAKRVCSMNKITLARKAVKTRCNEDDAEAHAIDDFIPRKKKDNMRYEKCLTLSLAINIFDRLAVQCHKRIIKIQTPSYLCSQASEKENPKVVGSRC